MILIGVFLAVLPIAVTLTTEIPLSAPKCGYESCPKPKEGVINIHLVPHTHDDVGWLKTVDQYYYGNQMDIQNAGVQYILDSVVQELLHDPRKRFIYVETAFFWKWWQEQTDTLRHQVKNLVNRGQLEFIGGAWTMHDEATTHYQSIIDQFTWGFRRLNDTFGVCGRPKVGWQIDPFGHSRESAAIMAKMGFDGLFLGRIDWEDKSLRMKNKTAEMIWFTSVNDKSQSSRLFTSVLYNVYAAPKGFCFDVNCHDEPIVDNKHSPQYNARQRAEDFIDIMKNYSRAYLTNNILVTMGEDFMYMDAHMYFKNMDKLIRQINVLQEEGSKFNVFYSTPSCYLKAVQEANIPLPTKSDDFLPYSSDPSAFWTGFFTSRPTLKYFERIGNNYLQLSKQLYVLTNLGPEEKGDLNNMREAMGVMQHHDAITGTEKQHVAFDYARILTEGFKECDEINGAAFNKIMSRKSRPIIMENCMLLNISSCTLTEKENSFVVTLYNPLSRPVNYPVRLPVSSENSSYSILCPHGTQIPHQVVKIPDPVLKMPGRNSTAKVELVFIAENLPPLGFSSYFVTQGKKDNEEPEEIILKGKPIIAGYSEGPSIALNSDGKVVEFSISGEKVQFNQSFYYYNSAVGNNNKTQSRSSGAYIFRPNGSEVLIEESPEVKVFKGPVVTEVHQTFNSWISQVLRLYPGANFIEFQWMVGPIPITNGVGKEIITRFSVPEIDSQGLFYTDSNGREAMTRKLNYRPSWPVNLTEKVSGNYYPITTTISIKDFKNRFSIVTDRAQGGTSNNSGEIGIMVHRRMTHDDGFGVGEALNETAFGEGLIARGSHYLSLDNIAEVRKLVQEHILGAWTFVSPTGGLSYDEWSTSYNMMYSGLNAALPENVQILTLEPWSGSSVLLRLEHIMEATDDPKWSKAATVQIEDVFSEWKVVSMKEMLLGANQQLEESERLIWISETEDNNNGDKEVPSELTSNITLNPMQIRTFVIQLEKKKSV